MWRASTRKIPPRLYPGVGAATCGCFTSLHTSITTNGIINENDWSLSINGNYDWRILHPRSPAGNLRQYAPRTGPRAIRSHAKGEKIFCGPRTLTQTNRFFNTETHITNIRFLWHSIHERVNEIKCIYCPPLILSIFFMARQPLVGQGLLTVEVLRSNTHTTLGRTPTDEWPARLRDL
jgi:hypothetical protein